MWYEIGMELISPKGAYDLTQICDGINIEETLFETVEYFNLHTTTGLVIPYTSIEIKPNIISFRIPVKPGTQILDVEKVRKTLGNGLAKRLYNTHKWEMLSNYSKNEDYRLLFTFSILLVKNQKAI